MKTRKSILVLCTGNSARSQMAEGLLRDYCGDRFDVFSAGTKPGSVRREAITALADLGIDISGHRSKSVEEFADRKMDFVLTVCDNAQQDCPYFPATTRLVHFAFPDPATVEGNEEVRLKAFRDVRDQIKEYIPRFIEEIVDA